MKLLGELDAVSKSQEKKTPECVIAYFNHVFKEAVDDSHPNFPRWTTKSLAHAAALLVEGPPSLTAAKNMRGALAAAKKHLLDIINLREPRALDGKMHAVPHTAITGL